MFRSSSSSRGNRSRSSSHATNYDLDKPEDVLPKNEKALHKLPCRPPSINVQRFSSRNTYSGRLSNISDINQQKQRNLDVMLHVTI